MRAPHLADSAPAPPAARYTRRRPDASETKTETEASAVVAVAVGRGRGAHLATGYVGPDCRAARTLSDDAGRALRWLVARRSIRGVAVGAGHMGHKHRRRQRRPTRGDRLPQRAATARSHHRSDAQQRPTLHHHLWAGRWIGASMASRERALATRAPPTVSVAAQPSTPANVTPTQSRAPEQCPQRRREPPSAP